MRGTLASRLILWIGLPATGLFLIAMVLSSMRSRNHVMRETERSSRSLARYQAKRIEKALGNAAVVAEMIAADMEIDPKRDAAAVTKYLKGIVARNHGRIYGSCIAFEPFALETGERLLAPYYYWKGDQLEFVQLGNPDYNYLIWEWYRVPRDSGRPHWTEPYYDEGGGETVMVTYSVPFRRGTAVQGIATIDIAMNDLTAEVDKIQVEETGYAFVISREGKFLAFPDRSKIMRDSLFDLDPALAKKMTAGGDGFIRSPEPLKGGDAWIAFVPIATGGFSLGIVHPAEQLMAGAFALEKELLALGCIGILSLVAVLVLIVRSISRPVAHLSEAARRVAAGDLDVQPSPATRIFEFSTLTESFQKMTADLKKRMEELRRATAARERIEGELEAARLIQMSILPRLFPPFPDREEFSIHAVIRPAREVGGDFYDFYFVDRDRLCIVIGDVSGKGVPAALYMAVTMTLMRAHMAQSISPAAVLRRANDELCRDKETGMFVTLFCGLLDCRSGTLLYCNAGHHPPLLLRANGALESPGGPGGIALGASPKAVYQDSTTQLQPSDTLFYYTDGVPEATDQTGRFYGDERLATMVKKLGHLEPEALTSQVMEDLIGFSKGSESSDDITVLALKFLARSRTKADSGRRDVP